MKDAVRMDLLDAAFEGKQPCPTCKPETYQAVNDGSGMVYSFESEEAA